MCVLQIQAGLDASPADRGVYETHRWNPSKPFVADKVRMRLRMRLRMRARTCVASVHLLAMLVEPCCGSAGQTIFVVDIALAASFVCTTRVVPCRGVLCSGVQILLLPCMMGRQVVYSSSVYSIKAKHPTCAEGHIADKLAIQ